MDVFNNNNTGVMLRTMMFLANQRSENHNYESLYQLPADQIPDVNEVKCYGVYGCFPISSPWLTELRPVALYPKSPIECDPRFPVFTRKTKNLTPKFIDINDPDFVNQLGINPNGKIFFIAHGYLESGDRPWIQSMMEALLAEDSYGTSSVIIVDWGPASTPPYTQAVANIRLIGAITAHIINLLYEELNMPDLDKVHMIGHSLGAHLCGYAGYYLKKDFNLTLGRITGLDPAEPLFSQTEPLVRLDRTDATYVDIIHSDSMPFTSGGLGMSQPIGHVDFYPNGGYDQPGCDQPMDDYIQQEKGSFFWGIQQFVGCNHIRSHQFFLESIKPDCPFTAVRCESYEKFRQGECFQCYTNDNLCIQFGFGSREEYIYLKENRFLRDSLPFKAYFMTNPIRPYCRTHYKTSFAVSSSDESILHGGEIGIMSIKIHSHHNKETEKMPFTTTATHYEPGKNYTSIMAGLDVGIPKYATLNWEYRTNPLNPLTWRVLASPRVYVEYIIVESLEHKSKIILCPPNQKPVISSSPTVFMTDYCY